MALRECQLCKGYADNYKCSGTIHIDNKPNILFNASFWRPDKVNILFIAESPPFHSKKANIANDGYFYNPNESQRFYGSPSPLLGTLSWNLFKLVKIDSKLAKQQKLERFKDLNCYYTDAVKCRVERFNNKIIINKTVKNCSEYLQEEIVEVKPAAIVIMGSSALNALKCFSPFKEELQNSKLNILAEETRKQPIVIQNSALFFIPLPIWRNRAYLEIIDDTFEQLGKKYL